MPPRSNAFQKLILDIERQLTPNAKVVESLMLADSTGTKREVDVAIEVQSGVHPIRIALECRDHARPADVTWIDQLYGKYRDLPVNHVIAVSRSGFTEEALAKARILHFRTLTLADAITAPWAEDINRLARIQLKLERFEIKSLQFILEGRVPIHLRGSVPATLLVDHPCEPKPSVAFDLATSTVNAPEARVKLEGAIAGSRDGRVAVNIDMKGWVLIDQYRTRRGLARIDLVVEKVVETSAVAPTRADYGGAAVAYGDGKLGNFGVRAIATKLPNADGGPPLKIILSPPAASVSQRVRHVQGSRTDGAGDPT